MKVILYWLCEQTWFGLKFNWVDLLRQPLSNYVYECIHDCKKQIMQSLILESEKLKNRTWIESVDL